MQSVLFRLADFLVSHYRVTLLFFILVTVVLGYFATKLEQETTVRDLLPAHNQVVTRFEETVRHFDLVDRIVVVLEFEAAHLEDAQAFADYLADEIAMADERPQYLHWFLGNMLDEARDADFYATLKYLPRLIPEDQLDDLARRLTPEAIAQQVAANRRVLEAGTAPKNLVAKDPLDLLALANVYRREIAGNYHLAMEDGFIVSEGRDMLLLVGKPIKSPEDMEFSIALDNWLSAKIEDAKKLYLEEEAEAPLDWLEVGVTGPHPIAARENSIIRGDVINMFVSSFALVIILFVLAYRRPLAIFYVGIPLLAAEIWTLGIGYLLFGRLNLLTATFSAVIVSLGIDFAIHLFSRYLDERNHGYCATDALKIAMCETGLGTAVGGTTTALAFLALSFSSFIGVREFAIIAALGIMMCLLQMFVLLPCMILFRETWRKAGSPDPKPQWDFHVERIVATSMRHRKVSMVLLGLGTLFLGYHAVQLRFNTDLRSVRAKSNPAIKLQSRVTQEVGGSLRSLTFVMESDTQQGLYDGHQNLVPTLKSLKERGDVVRYDSLLNFLQRPEAQQNNMARLAQMGIDAEQVRTAFLTSLQEHNFRLTKEYQGYIDNLHEGLLARDAVTLDEVLEAKSPFVKPFLNRVDGKYKLVVHVYPAAGLWEKQNTRELTDSILQSIEGASAEIYVTGIQTISDELKRLMRQSFEVSTFLSILLVFAVLYVHFRKWRLVWLTLVPLLVAVVWMLGTMHVLGIDITILNFVATPLIIGIGIDDGVHIVEKYLHRTGIKMERLMASCGKAVTLTSLTTICGFSSLFLAQYSGFRSLGLCAILGVFFCWLGAVLVLPLLLDHFRLDFVRQKHDPGDSTLA